MSEVLLVTEPGGHLLEMWAMRDVVARERRSWCTVDGPDVRSLLRDEDVTLGHGPTCRSTRNLLRNLWVALRVMRRRRPRVVLCTGSGIVVPLAWVGRLFGARVLYVECGGRVDQPSLSCRLVAPVAHRVYVQWPELVARVRRAEHRGRLPWEAGPARGGSGALVTAGTSLRYPFDRLIRTASRLEGRVVVQRGISRVRPEGAEVVAFMTFDQLCEEMAAAGAIVTHAGIGSVLLALLHGHRPIVMARLPELGEAVDDHQVRFARRLGEAGVAVVIEDADELPEALARRARAGVERPPGDLLDCLRADVAGW